MPKTKSEIVQSVLNSFRPEPYIKKIKCGFDSNLDKTLILKVQFELDSSKLENRKPNKEKMFFHAKELANRIKRETKLPIKHIQVTVVKS